MIIKDINKDMKIIIILLIVTIIGMLYPVVAVPSGNTAPTSGIVVIGSATETFTPTLPTPTPSSAPASVKPIKPKPPKPPKPKPPKPIDTSTPTPSPTPLPTPIITDTPLPTSSPTPTDTPLPTSSATPLPTDTPFPPPIITGYEPTLSIVRDSPSTVTFNITIDQLANTTWRYDGVVTQENINVVSDSHTESVNIIGNHSMSVTVSNGNGMDSKTWNWDIVGTLSISADTSSVYIGVPRNVTFTVTRRCGIESSDNCSIITSLPVFGASVLLTPAFGIGNSTTDISGQTVMTVNATDNSTIMAVTGMSGFVSGNVTITASSFVPTSPPSGGEGGGGGGSSGGGGGSSGGGGVGSGEPYNNIFKFESQENDISIIPVTFKYNTPEIAVYEVNVTGKQRDDVTLRIESLYGKSALVDTTAPGVVYKNINMWVDSKRIKNATIQYKVENYWMDNNNLSADNIKMFRWDNNTKQWNELSTLVINRDDKYTYLESETDGFSSFAIGGMKGDFISINDVQNPGRGNMPGIGNRPEPTEVIGKRQVSVQFEIAIAILIIFLIAYTIKMKK